MYLSLDMDSARTSPCMSLSPRNEMQTLNLTQINQTIKPTPSLRTLATNKVLLLESFYRKRFKRLLMANSSKLDLSHRLLLEYSKQPIELLRVFHQRYQPIN